MPTVTVTFVQATYVRSRQDQLKVKIKAGWSKIKARSRRGQGKVERQVQGKINVRLKQSNHNHNHNYNLVGFDTFEINLFQSKNKTERHNETSSPLLSWTKNNTDNLINSLFHILVDEQASYCSHIFCHRNHSSHMFWFLLDRNGSFDWSGSQVFHKTSSSACYHSSYSFCSLFLVLAIPFLCL